MIHCAQGIASAWRRRLLRRRRRMFNQKKKTNGEGGGEEIKRFYTFDGDDRVSSSYTKSPGLFKGGKDGATTKRRQRRFFVVFGCNWARHFVKSQQEKRVFPFNVTPYNI